MITLEYFNGKEWIFVSEWINETFAWVSLGGDDFNYRTLDKDGKVLTDKSKRPINTICPIDESIKNF